MLGDSGRTNSAHPFELPISCTRKCVMGLNEMSSGIYREFLFFPGGSQNGDKCMPMVLVIGLPRITTVAISERVIRFLHRMNVGSGVQLAKDAPSVV